MAACQNGRPSRTCWHGRAWNGWTTSVAVGLLPGVREALTAVSVVTSWVSTVLIGNTVANARLNLSAFNLDLQMDLDVGAYSADAEIVPISLRSPASALSAIGVCAVTPSRLDQRHAKGRRSGPEDRLRDHRGLRRNSQPGGTCARARGPAGPGRHPRPTGPAGFHSGCLKPSRTSLKRPRTRLRGPCPLGDDRVSTSPSDKGGSRDPGSHRYPQDPDGVPAAAVPLQLRVPALFPR